MTSPRSYPSSEFEEGSPADLYYKIAPGTHVALEAEVVEVLQGGRLWVECEGQRIEVTKYQKVQKYEEGEWVVYVP